MAQRLTDARFNAGRCVLVAGCVYEIAAVASGDRVPTITALIKRATRAPWFGRFVLWLVMGFVADHFVDHASEAT